MLSNLAVFLLQSPQQDTASQAFLNPYFALQEVLAGCWSMLQSVSHQLSLQLMHMHLQHT